ncbi:MAG TPA: DUF1643 domain-containing protein [Jatrophihabitantaceae bacterium]
MPDAKECSQCGKVKPLDDFHRDAAAHDGRYTVCKKWKATAERTDPTDTRVRNFTRAWGYGAYTIVNLFAYRATDPDELPTGPEAIGPDQSDHVDQALADAVLTVAAWGASSPAWASTYTRLVGRLLRRDGAHVLGLTASGQPRHPLYMRADTKPVLWSTLGDAR